MKRFAKRIFDLTCALAGIIILSPILLCIALIAVIMQGPPILFTQMRPGLHGKPFCLYKFRTMADVRDEEGHILPDAKRLTRVGKVLRDTSIDELPQLLNVIKGDMSLVGPRPLLMEYLPLYTPAQARRHEMKPGITGLAQIKGRQHLPYSKKLQYDVWYVDHWSLLLDLKIFLISIAKVIKRENVNSGCLHEEVDDIGLTKDLYNFRPFIDRQQ